MIELQIINWFQKGDIYNDSNGRQIENGCKKEMIDPYDEEKWKDGKIYEFNNLKEIFEFTKGTNIHFTDEYANRFGEWSWEEIDEELYINSAEDNQMIFEISCHEEWRD